MESMERNLCQKAGLSIYFVVCIWFVSSVIRFFGLVCPSCLKQVNNELWGWEVWALGRNSKVLIALVVSGWGNDFSCFPLLLGNCLPLNLAVTTFSNLLQLHYSPSCDTCSMGVELWGTESDLSWHEIGTCWSQARQLERAGLTLAYFYSPL